MLHWDLEELESVADFVVNISTANLATDTPSVDLHLYSENLFFHSALPE